MFDEMLEYEDESIWAIEERTAEELKEEATQLVCESLGFPVFSKKEE